MSVAVDIVKNSKTIEGLKAELLKSQWLLQHGAATGSEQLVLENLSNMIGYSYLLARRLGFDFARLDRVLCQQIAAWESADFLDLESQWGDVSLLISYLAPKED